MYTAAAVPNILVVRGDAHVRLGCMVGPTVERGQKEANSRRGLRSERGDASYDRKRKRLMRQTRETLAGAAGRRWRTRLKPRPVVQNYIPAYRPCHCRRVGKEWCARPPTRFWCRYFEAVRAFMLCGATKLKWRDRNKHHQLRPTCTEEIGRKRSRHPFRTPRLRSQTQHARTTTIHRQTLGSCYSPARRYELLLLRVSCVQQRR